MLISSQTMTCQLVLATDYISTYGYFIYNDTTWNSSVSHPVTIGYDARDFVNYNRTCQVKAFIVSKETLVILVNGTLISLRVKVKVKTLTKAATSCHIMKI